MQSIFDRQYKTLPIPVVVFKDEPNCPVVYSNVPARMAIDPHLKTETFQKTQMQVPLQEFMLLQPASVMDNLLDTLRATGSIQGLLAKLLTFENKLLSIVITANVVHQNDETFYVLYFRQEDTTSQTSQTLENTSVLTAAMSIALQTGDIDKSINQILSFVGAAVRISRSYIFEEISPTSTSNTYEWCNVGVEPAIDQLKNLPKEDYNYDVIINRGAYITHDVRTLPQRDRVILEQQGIKSLAIIPLVHMNTPLGYVGFDDCETYRTWTSEEILLLQNTAKILASLLRRRESEEQAARSLTILQTIFNHLDSIIYINDLYTHKLVFANKALSDALGRPLHELEGKPCWSVLQKNCMAPCEFCPMNKMLDSNSNIINNDITWEFQNTVTGKWYLIRDSIIKWVDGRDVHIETATEITNQKVYEKQLEQSATYDMMTETYNREWGQKLLLEAMQTQREQGLPYCLVFIDIDGLKSVNDSLGHETGDSLIVETVRTIRSCVRKNDILCRWGGDEFLLLLQCQENIADRIMRDVTRKMESQNQWGRFPYNLSISYGITSLAADEESNVDAVVAQADKLMYENKLSKRS